MTLLMTDIAFDLGRIWKEATRHIPKQIHVTISPVSEHVCYEYRFLNPSVHRESKKILKPGKYKVDKTKSEKRIGGNLLDLSCSISQLC